MTDKKGRDQIKPIRFSVKEVEIIKQAADKTGLDFSTFIRFHALAKAKDLLK